MKRVGILGAGQLGRMMALAGYPLALEFVFYDTSGSPSANIGKIYSDPHNEQQELMDFLNEVDVVTYEFEHLPIDLAKKVADRKPLFPSVQALAICQNRELEKNLFVSMGIPVSPFRIVNDQSQLRHAAKQLGMPVVAKSLTQGYDGKGQAVISSAGECDQAWEQINHSRLIVESFVRFNRELSLVATRNSKGETAMYPLVENNHQHGILRYTLAPAPAVSPEIQHQAESYLAKIMSHLNYVGVLTIELFETDDGLLANEMAPRVHNSGHWSMDGAHTGQFENHLRAILDLPLGETTPHGVSAMVNLVGQHADTAGVLSLTDTHLHHYGKTERPNRKVGHININANHYDALTEKLIRCLQHVPGHYPLDCSLSPLK